MISRTSYLFILAAGASLLAPGQHSTAMAQDAEIEHCAELESDAARLACFDAAIKARQTAPRPGDSPDAIDTQPPAQPAQAPAADKPAQPPAAAEPAPAPTQQAERVQAPPASPSGSGEARQESSSGSAAPRKYTAVVTAMRKRPHGQVVVTLDNGEVWSEQYASRAFLVKVGDKITMKKSRFSPAYSLVTEAGKGYRMTRLE